jgi:hypothetical protein
MDKGSIRKEIAALINSIKDHSDSIGTRDQIPQLELELILHKIEKLYQKSIVFNYLNTLPAEIKPENKKAELPLNKVEAPAPVVVPEIKEASPQIKAEEPAPKFVHTEEKKISDEISSENAVKEKPVIDLFGTELKTSEKPKAEKKVVVKAEPTVTKVARPGIADLRAAIGINDKFLFANELFNGNMTEYDIAIQQLNSAGSLESAMDYISNIRDLYSWDMESETVKRMLDLVDRRYI